MNKEEFIKELQNIGIKVTDEKLNNLKVYKDMLKENNKKFNLTNIIEDKDINLKHFYDSLYLMSIKEFKGKELLLDIGTGAGFPGIPLAIFNEHMKFTLVESNNKKCNFLKEIIKKLNLKNVEIINMRAEEYSKNNREKFDIATSRAVSHLKVLLELEIPSLKINGLFLPMKGEYLKEIDESESTLEALSSKIIKIYNYTLPIENSKRSILVIKKTEKTNEKYPREYSKIINKKNRK